MSISSSIKLFNYQMQCNLLAFSGVTWTASSGADSQETSLEYLSLGTESKQVVVINTAFNILILSSLPFQGNV